MSTATCTLCCRSTCTSSSSWRLLSCVAPLLALLMLLVLPAASHLLWSFVMLCLQMGHVLLSFSQGSTHFLWNSCLWREKDKTSYARWFFFPLVERREKFGNHSICNTMWSLVINTQPHTCITLKVEGGGGGGGGGRVKKKWLKEQWNVLVLFNEKKNNF